MTRKHTLMLAATLTLGMSAASGQDTMNANIPFAFQIPGTELPAGKYIVTPLSGGSIIQLRNTDTPRNGALVVVRNTGDSREGAPRLVFNCYNRECSLAKLSFGGGRGWECANPAHVSEAQKERLATVYLQRSKGQ